MSVRERKTIDLAVAMEGRLGREALVALLSTQPDFRVLGAVGAADEVLALCAEAHPRVLVLGITAGWAGHTSPAQSIRAASPSTRVLALAPHGRDRCAHLNPLPAAETGRKPRPWMLRSTCLPRALARGALGAINGDTGAETLFAAVRTVASGRRWRSIGPVPARQEGRPLSPQELRVARLVGEGSSNKEIADSLSISDLTVKKHVGSIFRKLGLQDRLQLGLCIARNPRMLDGDAGQAG